MSTALTVSPPRSTDLDDNPYVELGFRTDQLRVLCEYVAEYSKTGADYSRDRMIITAKRYLEGLPPDPLEHLG